MLEPINVDEEAMRFYLDYSVNQLWRLAFVEEVNTVGKIRLEKKNGNKYHDSVIETFLNDYDGSKKIMLPRDYSFPYAPSLMQLYVAYKVKTLPYFGNFSGTGAGKTLSAVLASRVIGSRSTVIICPNDVVDQWRSTVLEVFPNSIVKVGKDSFNAKYPELGNQYLIFEL